MTVLGSPTLKDRRANVIGAEQLHRPAQSACQSIEMDGSRFKAAHRPAAVQRHPKAILPAQSDSAPVKLPFPSGCFPQTFDARWFRLEHQRMKARPPRNGRRFLPAYGLLTGHPRPLEKTENILIIATVGDNRARLTIQPAAGCDFMRRPDRTNRWHSDKLRLLS